MISSSIPHLGLQTSLSVSIFASRHLTLLANQYMESIIDKDMQCDHLKKVTKILGQRVQELEAAIGIGSSAAAESQVP